MTPKKNKPVQNRIAVVDPEGIASELGVEAGDRLLSINGTPVQDVIDYLFLTADEYIEVEIEKPDKEVWLLEIDKEFDEKLGIEFENPIMDDARSCKNACVFCFIDQMPPGMRDSLYFKDDDSRLSFLQGNFITLTNVSDSDIDRMIRYQISPVNVSIHTTNPELRTAMLGNRFAGDVLLRMTRLAEGGVKLNGQIVLCPGWNDGLELDRTIRELSALYPGMTSLAVVPVGLTRHRSGLPDIPAVDRDMARKVLAQLEGWQEQFQKTLGTRFVYAADEFYLRGEIPVPPLEAYEGFPQIENGVGLIQKFQWEFDQAFKRSRKRPTPQKLVVATGVLAAPFIGELCDRFTQRYPQVQIDVITVENHFFGQAITVTGLLTGQDLIRALKGHIEGDRLLISQSMLKAEETLFLDDMTLEGLETELGIPCQAVPPEGSSFYRALTGPGGKA